MPSRFRLDNGLTVVFQEEHAAKVVAFQLWVKAGSADEREDQAGLAHFHEHMLFKGTERRGVGEVAKEVEAHGGEINAWTSYDQTVYHVVMASAFAKNGLDVLADAVRRPTLDGTEVAKETEVVCEEIKRSEDSPQRRIWKDLVEIVFEKHPYRLPILGTEASVRGFTREKVREFYLRHYTPDNIVLAAAGDFSPDALQKWAEELLGGDWGRKFAGPIPHPTEPAQTKPRGGVKGDDVKEAYLQLSFPIPAASHADVPALDVLGVVLGQGQASRLSLEVKRQRSLVNDISAHAYTLNDSGLFIVGMTLPKESLTAALEESGRILGECARKPVLPVDLQRAQCLIEAEAVYARESVQGLARKLGFYETVLGGFEAEAAYYAQVKALTSLDVQRVAVKALDLSRSTLVARLPKETDFTLEQAFAAVTKGFEAGAQAGELGTPGKPSTPHLPPRSTLAPKSVRRGEGNIVVETLSSGARIIIREERAVPLFAMRAAFKGGGRYETDADAGITAMLARMLTRGTPELTAEEISRRVDGMAAGLGGVAGRNSISLRGEFLSRDLEEGFALFADVLEKPNFPVAELERERRLTLQAILTKDDRPSSLVGELLAKALYKTHPYRLPLGGELESVKALTSEALHAYHQGFMHPSKLHLAVVGDVSAERVLELAEQVFRSAGPPPPPPPPIAPEAPLEKPRSLARPLGKAQSHLMVGFHGARLDEPWRYALEVLCNALSGMGGRLFLTLRDQESLAYSVTAYSVEGLDTGYFAVYIGTSPDKQEAALEGIRKQLNRVCDELLSPAELSRARQNLIGGHEIGLQRAGARAALLALDDCYGHGLEGFLRYSEKIARVTAEEVRDAARRVIRWSQCAVAKVGPNPNSESA